MNKIINKLDNLPLVVKTILGGITGVVSVEFLGWDALNWQFWALALVVSVLLSPTILIIIWKEVLVPSVKYLPEIMGALLNKRNERK